MGFQTCDDGVPNRQGMMGLVILLVKSGLLHDFLGNFSMQDEIYYFHVEIESMRGEIEMNIRKLRIWKNSNFFFGWRGPLVMISCRVCPITTLTSHQSGIIHSLIFYNCATSNGNVLNKLN